MTPAEPAPSRHAVLAPSDWVQRFAPLVPAGATVLDVACGAGRHTRLFAARGCAVTAVDRDNAALQALHNTAQHAVRADLEADPWPLPGARFGAVVVTNYLWRPLWPALLASLAEDGGVLIYETFGAGQAAFGKPSNPDFLLQPGELLQRCAGLHVVAYEDGTVPSPRRCVQRIVAVRGARHPADGALPGYTL